MQPCTHTHTKRERGKITVDEVLQPSQHTLEQRSAMVPSHTEEGGLIRKL